ncbi:MAG: radical SAM protein [Nitrospiraceae bacterium]|nr:radical SAM protein [Nitrospiraceae bacterium]
MKVLFFWIDIGSGHKPSFHHGIAWISGRLISEGHEVKCMRVTQVDDLSPYGQIVADLRPDVVGISITTNQRKYLETVVAEVRKRHSTPIVVGGVHCILDPADVIACDGIDGVCVGEGDLPMSVLMSKLSRAEGYSDTPSFWWKIKGLQENKTEIVKNALAPFEDDLNSLPLPNYSVFDADALLKELAGYFNVMVSRGCPYNCSYCCNHAIRSAYRRLSGYFRILTPSNAVSLIKGCMDRHSGIRGFIFEDDLLLWDKNWFLAFADEYRMKIGLPYICNGHINSVDQDIVNALVMSGCRSVMLGLESGDEELRATLLRRHYSNEKVMAVANLFHKSGIQFFTYNIFGFPFETKEQMARTVQINTAIRPHSGQAFFFYPYPGTDLYNLCKEHNLLNRSEMESVSGYREKPTIRLTNCSIEDCIRQHNTLQLYFISRRFARVLSLDSKLLDKTIHSLLMIYPSFLVRLFSKENVIKKVLRWIQYRFLR